MSSTVNKTPESKSELPPKTDLIKWLIVLGWMFLGVYIRDQYVPRSVYEAALAKLEQTTQDNKEALVEAVNNASAARSQEAHNTALAIQGLNTRLDGHCAREAELAAKLKDIEKDHRVVLELFLQLHPEKRQALTN